MSVALFGLDSLGLADTPRVGAKAATLGALLARGLPVPPGFALADPEGWAEAAGRDLSQAWPLDLGREPGAVWIARSSAAVEDGAAASFAGQFESLAGLTPGPRLIAAVRRVARPGRRARAYARRCGIALGDRIPVLVQRQIAAVRSGVLFTVDPLGGQRLRFAVDGGEGAEVTDGKAASRMLVFDPLEPSAALACEPVLARALPRLAELAFASLAALGAGQPLDLEWLIDADGQVWIVQARPVTACAAAPDPRAGRLLEAGFAPQSPRPVSRLAALSFQTAGEVDRRAADFHPAWFDRQVAGPWLFVKRVKTRSRPRIEARTRPGFLLAWGWARRRNLAFALLHLPAFRGAVARADRLAREVLGGRLPAASPGRLGELAEAALSLHRDVRRVHAALWYPVDLSKDLAAFEERFGPPGLGASLPRPARRTARDRETAALVAALREAHAGLHPAWAGLDPAQRARVLRHLARHPYAFESSAEVQDPAAWRSWLEAPEQWWSGQAGSTAAELAQHRAPRPEPLRGVGAAAGLLRAAVGTFTPLKDDRVELLALAGAVLRALLLELERRAGGEGEDGWSFELEPAELLRLASSLARPGEVRSLRAEAIRRQRARVLEELAAGCERQASPSPAPLPPAGPGGLELAGIALSAGIAVGRACAVASAGEAQRRLRPGDVLVLEELRPAFTSVMPRAAALVCRRGSPLSHGAIVARELSIPAVALEDLAPIRSGDSLRVDGGRGTVGLEPSARG